MLDSIPQVVGLCLPLALPSPARARFPDSLSSHPQVHCHFPLQGLIFSETNGVNCSFRIVYFTMARISIWLFFVVTFHLLLLPVFFCYCVHILL